MLVALAHIPEAAAGTLQGCDLSAGCRDTEGVHGAGTAHCNIHFYCNITRSVMLTLAGAKSWWQVRTWPNTCIIPTGPCTL